MDARDAAEIFQTVSNCREVVHVRARMLTYGVQFVQVSLSHQANFYGQHVLRIHRYTCILKRKPHFQQVFTRTLIKLKNKIKTQTDLMIINYLEFLTSHLDVGESREDVSEESVIVRTHT